MKLSILDRILLLSTSLLAAYQIAVGINELDTLPIITYTIAFGVLLVACLLLIILDLEVLDSPIVVVVSTIIPLSLSLGLVWEQMDPYRIAYLAFAILGFLAIILTRLLPMKGNLPIIVLSLVHGIAGLVIFILPISLVIVGKSGLGFALVGAGGALMGVGGLFLSFLKVGRPILSQTAILRILPGLLLLMTIAFVIGFQQV
jgi:hypothetical protein